MELTPAEEKFVEQTRKLQQCWPKRRWFAIAICLWHLCITLGMAVLVYKVFTFESRPYNALLEGIEGMSSDHLAQKVSILSALLNSSREALLFVSIAAPVLSSFLLLNLANLMQVILKWRGHPERTLLLKLLDAQTQAQK